MYAACILIDQRSENFSRVGLDQGWLEWVYAYASEVVRAGLRLLEQEEQKLSLLGQALIEGEESGWVENFNPADLKAKLKKNNPDLERYL